jgi:hypothetical protein
MLVQVQVLMEVSHPIARSIGLMPRPSDQRARPTGPTVSQLPTNSALEITHVALLSCPECSKDVSDKALSCPHCGCPRTTAPREHKAEPQPAPRGSTNRFQKFLGFFAVVLVVVGIRYVLKNAPEWERDRQAKKIEKDIERQVKKDIERKLKEAAERAEKEAGLAKKTPPVIVAHPTTKDFGPILAHEVLTLNRPAFTFKYLQGWKVDTQDKDYNPDHQFTIDAPDRGLVSFVISDDKLDLLEEQEHRVTLSEKVMTNATRTEFTRWSKYDGRGTELRGPLTETGRRMTIRIFTFHAAGKTFAVFEYFPDEEKQRLQMGYKTIEDSFHVVR